MGARASHEVLLYCGGNGGGRSVLFVPASEAYENSVLGCLRRRMLRGPHRLICAGDHANHFFEKTAGYVDLANFDVLTRMSVPAGSSLYMAMSDVSHCD